MPAFIKTAEDEKRWAKAKSIVSKQRKISESKFGDSEYALTNHIYHNMIKSSIQDPRSKDVPVLLAHLQRLLGARRERRSLDRDHPTSGLLQALSRLAAVTGAAISTLRRKPDEGTITASSQDLIKAVDALADRIKTISRGR